MNPRSGSDSPSAEELAEEARGRGIRANLFHPGEDLDLLSIGERERLDEGLLHLYAGSGILRASWTERSGERFEIDARAGALRAGIDGEPARLETPLEFEIAPLALRVLVPPA